MKILLLGPSASRRERRSIHLLHEALAAQLRGEDGLEVSTAETDAGPGPGHWIAPLRTLLRIRRRSRGCDVLHCLDIADAWYVPACRCRTVVTIQDVGLLRYAHNRAAPWRLRALASLQLAAAKRADQIACSSQATLADVVARASIPAAKLVCVPMAMVQTLPVVGRAEATSLVSALVPELGGRPYLLHIGSNIERKNRIGLVQALARIPADLHAVFAGVPLAGAALDEALRLGLQPRIHSVANPSPHELAALYTTAHALVFPSTYEGFGLPVLEAQSLGCPVVCGDIPALRETGGDAALFCAPADPAGFVATIRAVGEPAQRDQLVARGRVNIGRFSITQVARDYLGLYHRLVRREAAEPASAVSPPPPRPPSVSA